MQQISHLTMPEDIIHNHHTEMEQNQNLYDLYKDKKELLDKLVKSANKEKNKYSGSLDL